jgi:hypothetical protein
MQSSKPRVPQNLEEYRVARQNFFTKEGWRAGQEFQPRPTDVLISPFGKSGTTWLQQIVHGLRTRGSMDFGEITEMTPWVEQAYDIGWDLEADQIADPRAFKSHMSWYDIPKGGRYICSIRDPYDVTKSYYRFHEGWWFERDSISLETFTHDMIISNPEAKGYFYHLVSWLEQQDNQDVLLLCFENLKADLPTAVKAIARFMEIDLDSDLLDIVLRQSSKEFMLEHQSQFDAHPIQAHFERRGVTPAVLGTSKVTRGAGNNERYRLSSELKGELDAVWDKVITQRFGFKDYSELRTAIAKLNI